MPGLDNYTKLLLHCDGADESTTFTDSSSFAHTMTPAGSVKLDTEYKQFGSASGIGADDWGNLSASDSVDWFFNYNNLTIDLWLRFLSTGEFYIEQVLDYETYADTWCITITESSFKFELTQGGVSTFSIAASPTLSAGTFYHFELVRKGATSNDWLLFIDGVAQSVTITGDPSLSIPDYDAPLMIWPYLCNFDELRISNGIARHTENFTPETEAYPDDPVIICCLPISCSVTLNANIQMALKCVPILSTIIITAAVTQFTIQNPSLLYFFTLTGAPDGLADVVIPIKSFQARHRSGDPSYLSVVIPGLDYATAIAARSNGEMVIHMSKAMRGVIYHTEEIIRVELETIRTDDGSTNESITLDGHKTSTYPAKTIALEGVNYHSVNDGKKLYRCAAPNIYLRPGDTATYGGDSFTVGLVTYYVGNGQQSMEVSEADI